MKLSAQEKAARKAAFRTMSPDKKLEHIWIYYKWPILLALAALLVLGSVLHRALTQKQPLLYLAFANVAVGEELQEELTLGYLQSVGEDPARREVYLYPDLYLSDDAEFYNHEYAYASRMKTMGAIQAQKMDVVLMNREVYDAFSREGYLADLTALLAQAEPSVRRAAQPYLIENDVILEDNTIDWQLGEAEEQHIVTERVFNALDLNTLPLIQEADMSDAVYLGVIANSPRSAEALDYIYYLLTVGAS